MGSACSACFLNVARLFDHAQNISLRRQAPSSRLTRQSSIATQDESNPAERSDWPPFRDPVAMSVPLGAVASMTQSLSGSSGSNFRSTRSTEIAAPSSRAVHPQRLRRWTPGARRDVRRSRRRGLRGHGRGRERPRRRHGRQLSLEQALEFASADECVEVTPDVVRLRKVELSAQVRGRNAKRAKSLDG